MRFDRRNWTCRMSGTRDTTGDIGICARIKFL
jgi:hypothetical protein